MEEKGEFERVAEGHLSVGQGCHLGAEYPPRETLWDCPLEKVLQALAGASGWSHWQFLPSFLDMLASIENINALFLNFEGGKK